MWSYRPIGHRPRYRPSQPRRIEVVKNRPRSRREIKSLVGSLTITATACSRKLGDHLDSHLHVGTGGLPLKILSDAEEVRGILEKYRGDLTQAWREVEVETGYDDFTLVGGRPVLPGSSVKGNVRSRLELSFTSRGGRIRACFVRASPPGRRPRRGSRGWRHHELWRDVLHEERGPQCDPAKGVCLLCDLFGAVGKQGLEGLVRFGDLYGIDVKLQRLSLPYGMRIYAAPPASRFKGVVEFRSLEPHELGLILLGFGIEKVRKGRPVLFGRLKYRKVTGRYKLGRLTYTLDELRLSSLSEPLQSLAPGGRIQEGELDSLIQSLVEEARQRFEGELQIVDEVEKIERL